MNFVVSGTTTRAAVSFSCQKMGHRPPTSSLELNLKAGQGLSFFAFPPNLHQRPELSSASQLNLCSGPQCTIYRQQGASWGANASEYKTMKSVSSSNSCCASCSSDAKCGGWVYDSVRALIIMSIPAPFLSFQNCYNFMSIRRW